MGLFKSHVGKKTEQSFKNRETTEQFLARGGKIQVINEGISSKKQKSTKKIDAQVLLDAATGTAQEQEVINFLKTQGIEVEC